MRNFTDLYEETVEEKKSPSEIMQHRRKMSKTNETSCEEIFNENEEEKK